MKINIKLLNLLDGNRVCRKKADLLEATGVQDCKHKKQKVWNGTGLYTRNWVIEEQTLHEIRHLKGFNSSQNGENSKEERSITPPSELSNGFR
jgi:hypothetical protein